MGRKVLASLDLFSGVGGLTVALKGLVRPVAFCDIESAAQAVLTDRMQRRLLPSAPICTDVRQLTPAWLRANTTQKPEAIIAGFPCVGFSLIGKRQGYDEAQSGLFKEILRIVDEHSSIRYLFLENVARFLHDGMSVLLHELHTKRKFSVAWCIVSAADVGAPQQRRRWFGIAYRGSPPPPAACTSSGYTPAHTGREWAKEPKQRTACPGGPPKYSLSHNYLRGVRRRLRLLGNSVVPDAARYAYCHLLAAVQAPVQGKSVQVKAHKGAHDAWPACGLAHGKELAQLTPPPPLLTRPHQITLDPRADRPDRGYTKKNQLAPLRGKKALSWWATPRAGLVTGCQVITSRTSHDLPSQIRWEQRTPDIERPCAMSPEWAEWLMG